MNTTNTEFAEFLSSPEDPSFNTQPKVVKKNLDGKEIPVTAEDEARKKRIQDATGHMREELKESLQGAPSEKKVSFFGIGRFLSELKDSLFEALSTIAENQRVILAAINDVSPRKKDVERIKKELKEAHEALAESQEKVKKRNQVLNKIVDTTALFSVEAGFEDFVRSLADKTVDLAPKKKVLNDLHEEIKTILSGN